MGAGDRLLTTGPTSMKIAVGVSDSFASQRNPAEWIRAQGITLSHLRGVPERYG